MSSLAKFQATYSALCNAALAMEANRMLTASEAALITDIDPTRWTVAGIASIASTNPESDLFSIAVLAEEARTQKLHQLSDANDMAALVMRSCAPINGEDKANAMLEVIWKVVAEYATSFPNLYALSQKHKGAVITVRRLIGSLSYFARFLMAVTNNSPVVMAFLIAAYEDTVGWLAGIQQASLQPPAVTQSFLSINPTLIADCMGESGKSPLASSNADVQHLRSLNFGAASGVMASPLAGHIQAAIAAQQQPAAAPIPTANLTPAGSDATQSIVNAINQPTTTENATMNTTATAQAARIATALSAIPAGPMRDALSAMLGGLSSGVTLNDIIDADSERAKLAVELDAAKKEAERLMSSLRAAQQAPTSMTLPAATTTGGALPSGKVDWVPVSKVFTQLKGIELSIPVFTWDGPHPDVPAIDNDYVFRKALLLRTLRSIAANERTWLVGHTGSGKTTFVEQIAARIGYPLLRVALDANVDRSALMGRMQLKADGKGGTISEWLPGIVERAIANGYILLLDEIDASHPNSIFALQPVLEGRALPLLEDGGRLVPMHPMSRIVATGNTAGSGDPSGLYPATRILSAATLDRFAEFVEVPYMTQAEEASLIKRVVPGLPAALVTKLAKFGTEMRAAFVKQEVPISYSPRRSIAFARAVETYLGLFGTDAKGETKSIDLALAGKLVCATPEEFRPRITELARTCLAATGNSDASEI